LLSLSVCLSAFLDANKDIYITAALSLSAMCKQAEAETEPLRRERAMFRAHFMCVRALVCRLLVSISYNNLFGAMVNIR